VWSDDKLAERVAFMHENVGTDALVEHFIEGRELYVGVVGDTRLDVFPFWELHIDKLRADAPKLATRRVKWDVAYQKRRGVRTARAEDLSPATQREMVRTTKRLYKALGLSGYARVDFRLDADGKPWFLEANPNPDIMYGGEFAETAEAAGIEYEDLLQRIVNLGLRQRRRITPSAAVE
jgi:D-alanine-D-alanine ligase